MKRLALVATIIAVGLAVGASLIPKEVWSQQDPWWNPRNPFGQSYGVTYGTQLPTLANTGMQPVDGLLAVQLTAGSVPTLSIYDQSTSTWQAFVGAGGVGFPLQAPDGSAAAPSYSFANDTDLGIYRAGAAIAFTIGGVQYAEIAAGFVSVNVGSVGVPSYNFLGDTDSGMYRVGADQIGFSVGGNLEVSLANDVFAFLGSGSAAAPLIRLGNDPDSGLYSAGADSIAISAGGTVTATFSADGVLPRTYAFAALPASANGNIVYCSDCTAGGSPCAGAGNGSIAFRLNGAWECTL
jgi:hypothetical protein